MYGICVNITGRLPLLLSRFFFSFLCIWTWWWCALFLSFHALLNYCSLSHLSFFSLVVSTALSLSIWMLPSRLVYNIPLYPFYVLHGDPPQSVKKKKRAPGQEFTDEGHPYTTILGRYCQTYVEHVTKSKVVSLSIIIVFLIMECHPILRWRFLTSRSSTVVPVSLFSRTPL